MTTKSRSALQAVRNGNTGQVVVLPQPDMASFQSFTAAIVASFSPADAHEHQLAHSYASFQWRLNRITAIEDSLLTLGIMEEVAENLNLENPEVHNAASNAKTFREEFRAFDRLGMYNQRLVNSAAKVLAQLERTQAARRHREEQAMTDAVSLFKFHRMQKVAFDPAQNGFALTIDQIQDHIRRTNLHNLAQIARQVDYNSERYAAQLAQTAA